MEVGEELKRGKKNLCLNLKKKICRRKVGNKIGQDTVIPDYGRPWKLAAVAKWYGKNNTELSGVWDITIQSILKASSFRKLYSKD